MTKDTRKLLVESSEFISKIKLSKGLKESVKLSAGKAGTLIVKNVPCTILNRRNLNGRIYSTQLLEEAIRDAQDAIASRQLLCAGNEHPDGSFVPPTEASHVVINAYIKKNISVVVEGKKEKHDVLFMDLMLLNTVNGKNARALFEAECSVGTSIRGLGDLNGDIVENYQLLGVDLVGQPSSGTYSRMPISESVKVELADEKALTEGFTLTTSSTNVVRDLETAAEVQNRINAAQYGTITKTSTKVDEELNPKTGATTSITTLETETQDEVASLDQALAMAKRAMTNGVSHIDSITIDNIEEEEDQKESLEQIADQPDTIEMGKDDPNITIDEGALGTIASGLAGGVAGAAVGHPIAGAMAGMAIPKLYDKYKNSKGIDFSKATDKVKAFANDYKKDQENKVKIVTYAPNNGLPNHRYFSKSGKIITSPTERDIWAIIEALHVDWEEQKNNPSPEWRRAFMSLIDAKVPKKMLRFIPSGDATKMYKDLIDKQESVDNIDEGIAGALLGGVGGAFVGHPIIGAAAGSLAQDALLDDSKEEPVDEGFLAGTALGGAAGAALGGIPGAIIGGAVGGLGQEALLDDSNVDSLDQDLTTGDKIEYEPESALNEEGSLNVVDLNGTDYVAPVENDLWNIADDLRKNIKDKDTLEWQKSYQSLKKANPEQYIIDWANGKEIKESIKEAKEADPNEGRRFVLKCPAGFVAMDGNALVFKANPKEAIHFIVGKEESGLVHLSGVEKILDTMGVYDVEKYYRKDKKQNNTASKKEGIAPVNVNVQTGDIASNNNVTDNKVGITEDSNTQFTATVKIGGDSTEQTTDTIPVSATDMSAVNAEVSNLYDMKVKSAGEGQSVDITVIDNINKNNYHYNPETKVLDYVGEQAKTEAVGDIEQNNKTLKMDVTDDITVEKEFDTQAAASVAKSGLEQGKLEGDVMLSEADDEHSISIHVEKALMDNPTGPYYNAYFFNKADDMVALDQLIKDINAIIPNYANYGRTPEQKPYIIMTNISEAELNKLLTGLQEMRHFEFGWKDGVGKIKAPVDEKLYSQPIPGPSDDFVEKPLTDATDNITITLSDIDWDVDSIADLLLDGNKDLTWVEKINALPSKLNITITADELNSAEDVEALKEILLKSANETSNVVINGATIEGIV